MRCKHNGNLRIEEEMLTTITHVIENGEKQGEMSLDGEGDPTGMVDVICVSCRKKVRFNYRVSYPTFRRLPAWVRNATEVAGITAFRDW